MTVGVGKTCIMMQILPLCDMYVVQIHRGEHVLQYYSAHFVLLVKHLILVCMGKCI